VSEWQNVTIGDVTELVTKGTTPSTYGEGFTTHGVNFIKSEAVSYDGKINKSTFVYISHEMHEKLKRSQLKENDILFSMAGIFLGKTGLVTKEMLPANTNQALAIIRVNPNIATPNFIHYFLRQKNTIEYVNNISGQSAQPNINFQEIKSIELSLPKIDEQKAIASILSSLDDKIDLLHRQNTTLERMAETLFRQWFVEAAQEDWEEKPLSYYGEIVCGKTPSKQKHEYFNGDVPFIKIPDMHGNTFIFKTEDNLTELGKNSQSNKTIPVLSICVSCIATVGLVSITTKPSQTNQQINSIIPKHSKYRYFLFLTMKASYDLLHAEASGGTATLNLNTGNFSKMAIPLPPENLLLDFEKIIDPAFNKIYQNQSQIQTLERLRDTLLPKLMSGDVRVTLYGEHHDAI
jgi:type I restriction enzyme, S subunit